MSKGWIKLYRSITENILWRDKPFSKGQAWIDLLLRASHENSSFMLGSTVYHVEPGQFVTSELKLMEAWGWGRTKTRSFLKMLEDEQMIVKKSYNNRTVINIVNWASFQGLQTTTDTTTVQRPNSDRTTTEQQINSDRTTTVQRPNTIKNIENDKNDKNEKNEENVKKSEGARARFKAPSVDQVEAFCLENGLAVEADRFVDYYTSNGWMVGNAKMKDWKAAVRNWARRDQKQPARAQQQSQVSYFYNIATGGKSG